MIRDSEFNSLCQELAEVSEDPDASIIASNPVINMRPKCVYRL